MKLWMLVIRAVALIIMTVAFIDNVKGGSGYDDLFLVAFAVGLVWIAEGVQGDRDDWR